MGKMLRKLNILMICICLCVVCLFDSIVADQGNIIAHTRSVELSQSKIDNDYWFSELDSYDIYNVDNKTILDGERKFSYTELEELDLVSQTDKIADLVSKYNCIYDWNTNRVLLTIELEYNGTIVTDTITGVIITNETGEEFDVVFSIDDEFVLLSEIAEYGVVDNIGFFKKVWSKLKSSVSKVLSQPSGIAGTVITVAVCAAVGVGVAMSGGTLGVALLAGAAVGAAGACGTAIASTWKSDGQIDWETVAVYTGIGACVGAIVSGGAYGITCCVSDVPAMKRALKIADNNPTSKTTYIGKFKPNDGSAGYVDVAKSNAGNYYSMDDATWNQLKSKYGEDFMTELNKNFITGKYNVGNEFIATADPAKATGDFLKEVNWLRDMCAAKGRTARWEKIGNFLWKLVW